MTKRIIKILICMLILLIGIGAASAIDCNSTDENIAVDDSSEVLSLENNNDKSLGLSEDTHEISKVENNNDSIAISNNIDKALSVENKNNTLAINKNNNNKTQCLNKNNNTTIGSSIDDIHVGKPEIIKGTNLKLKKLTQTDNLLTKEMVFGKVKILKKDFKRFILKTPSKKNKKLWKKYKKFDKKLDKKLEKSMTKRMKSIIKKKWEFDWSYNLRLIFALKGKYCTINIAGTVYKYV